MRQLLNSFIVISFCMLNGWGGNVIFAQEKVQDTMLIGNVGLVDLKNSSVVSDWYVPGYSAYVPDAKTIEEIKGVESSDLSVTIVLGTWCSDSQEQVPHFLKMWDELGWSTDNLNFICVDRNKKAEGMDLSMYRIEKVPTFIFWINDEEIGRIIENPENTIENDLLNIIKK